MLVLLKLRKLTDKYPRTVARTAALSLGQSVSAAVTPEGALDGIAFASMHKYVLAPTLRPGKIVVLDNLQIYKNQAIRGAVEARGCELLFLPLYSPDSLCPLGINPIDHAFSRHKAFVRRHNGRTKQALDAAIAAALKAITLQDVISWFSYAGYLPQGF